LSELQESVLFLCHSCVVKVYISISIHYFCIMLIRLFLVGFIFFGIAQSAVAGKVERAFNALEEYNYFKAKGLFEKSLKRNPSPASYGLAVIFYRSDNPFHSLDSAYRYILVAEKEYSLLKEKKKEGYKKFSFDYLHIAELQRSISSGFFLRAKKEHTVEAYQTFIDFHPWSIEYHAAIFKRDSLAYDHAKSTNTSVAYDYFIKKYPESTFLSQATADFFRSQYMELTLNKSLSSYIDFLKKCPDNPYVNDAENRIYEIVTEPNSVLAFEKFIQNYPTNHNIGEAWRRLYQLFMVDFSENRIDEFREAYPAFPYTEELETDLLFAKREILPYKQGTYFGFMDYAGKVVVEATYEYLGFFREGLAAAAKNGKYGFIDKGNRVVIPFEFDNVSDFENGRAVVECGGKLGMIDRGGKRIFECEFEDLGAVSEGFVYGAKGEKYGFYEKNGSLRIEERFDEAYSFTNGIAKVQIDDRQAYIDPFGTYIIPPGYDNISFFTDSLLIFEDDAYFGLMLRNCTPLQKAEFDEIAQLSDGRALFVKDDLIGYFDEKGKVVLPPKFETFPNYLQKANYNGAHAIAVSKGKYGVIDRNGKFIIAPSFQNLGQVSSLMAFTKGKGWGFIDLTGKEIIKPQFEFAESFIDGQAIVEQLTLSGVIDQKGNFVLPCAFASVNRLGSDMYLVSNGSKFGVYNKKGKMLVPLDYQQIRFFNDSFLILTNSEDLHYFYLNEQRIIQPLNEQEE
jgi:hypothetical protein